VTAHVSLQVTLDWFKEQAENPDNSDDDRALWQQLADELEHRLGTQPVEEPTLW